jgi:hypothetical protein
MTTLPIYGLLAEFASIEELIEAVRAVRREGYTRLDAYTPAPVEELAEELGFHRSRLPWVVFAGGLTGCVGGFLMQHYCAAISYPLNIGGRPLFSWPAWIPITFEMTVLVGAITAILAMLGMNGLPQPYHPLFNVERFACASKDRVFLCVEARDPKFDLEATKRLLAGLHPREVWEVPR